MPRNPDEFRAVSVRLPVKEYDELLAIGKAEKRSLANLVEVLVHNWLLQHSAQTVGPTSQKQSGSPREIAIGHPNVKLPSEGVVSPLSNKAGKPPEEGSK
jgi:hypothetical protein